MVKESYELSAATAALKKSAEDFGDPGRLVHLKNGINSLLEVMSGESAQIQKDISKRLVLTYRNKLLSEMKVILANIDSHRSESLEHWNKAMQVFVDVGFDDDPEFNAFKEQLHTQLGGRPPADLTTPDLDFLEKELQATLDSLSAHKSRLSAGIKWETEK
jgi:hypothetical protein